MLTPPLHFAIACAPPQHAASTSSQILYRGAVPIKRNLEFVDRLQLKTILVVSKKEPKPDSDVVQWAEGLGLGVAGKGKGKCRQVEIKWIKAGKMEGEELGMGRAEVNEALKIVVQPANYPLYIADADGITHSSLVIGALRKLMGWHQDSIMNELARFDADDEDLPFASFFTSYLSPTPLDGSDSKAESATLQLPNPPYPCWLWPTIAASPATLLPPKGRSRSTSVSMPEKPPPPPPETVKVPETFPHPLSVRRHPTMRLVFPPQQNEAPPVSSPKKIRRVSFNASPVASPTLAAVAAADMGAMLAGAGSKAEEKEAVPAAAEAQNRPELSSSDVSETDVNGEMEYEEEEYEEDEDEEDEEEEDEEEEDDDDDKAAPSQLISALDLEGF